MTEPPARTEPGTATNHQGLPVMDSEILEMSPEKSDGIVEGIDVNGPKAQLMLRYPDGKREQITLPEQAKLLALVKHVQSKGYPNERFELLTNFLGGNSLIWTMILHYRRQAFVLKRLSLYRKEINIMA